MIAATRLNRKTARLRDQGRALIERQIGLEQAGVRPEEPDARTHQRRVEARARELLNGSDRLLPPDNGNSAGVDLADILFEKQAIDLTLTLLQREELELATDCLAEWFEAGGATRWLANRRRVANAVLAVRVAVAEARVIRNDATQAAGGMTVSSEADRGDRALLSSDAQAALEAIRDAGIIRSIPA